MPAFILPQPLLLRSLRAHRPDARVSELVSYGLPLTDAYDALDKVARDVSYGHALDVCVVVGVTLLALARGAATLRRRTA